MTFLNHAVTCVSEGCRQHRGTDEKWEWGKVGLHDIESSTVNGEEMWL